MDDDKVSVSDAPATDASSIKPVSSLRSRFESLAQEQQLLQQLQQQPPPASPITQRPLVPKQDTRRPSHDATLASTGILRASLDTSRPKSFAGTAQSRFVPSDQAAAAAAAAAATTTTTTTTTATAATAPFRKQCTPSQQRPISAFPASPRNSSLPAVSIESPHSPYKDPNVRITSATPSRSPPGTSPPTSLRPSPAASATHSRSPSRVTTPALEARMSAFLHAAQPTDQSSDSEKRDLNPTSQRPKLAQSAAPPPVNRAGKPKLSALPPSSLDMSDPFGSLAPATHPADHQEASPFSTPPSSSDSTPAERGLLSRAGESTRNSHVPLKQGYFSSVTEQRPPSDATPDKHPRPLSRSFEPRTYMPAPHYPRAQPSRQSIASAASQSTEDLPVLPPRRDRQIQSGRTSPVRQQRIPARRSMDAPRKPAAPTVDTNSSFAPPRRIPQSAVARTFDKASTPFTAPQKLPPPAVPAPRRSIDTRREDMASTSSTPFVDGRADDREEIPHAQIIANAAALNEFPDASQANRRPPRFKHRPWEIATGYDTRLSAVCGEFVCTTGYITRVWSLRTGESCLTIAHGENVKVTALAFKPTSNVNDEGRRLWLGTSIGEIHEIDIPTQSILHTKPNAHPRREIVKLYRHASQLWSLDDDGRLHVWPAGPDGIPSLDSSPRSFRTVRGHSCSIIIGSQLWLAAAKDIYVFQPGVASETQFQVLPRPLRQEGAGDITSAATISSKPDLVYFGHSDGKITIYSKRDFRCLGVVNISPYKVSSLAGAGDYLWAGYNTGKVYVYDTSVAPWRVMKDWNAHDNPVSSIITAHQSVWKMDRLQVVTLGLDNMLKIWDGMLEEDWLEARMQEQDDEFCKFEEMTATVLTWNAGASKPSHLRNDQKDSNFFREYLTSQPPPDIMIFGFQELVDLEDKKVTAKSFFRSKKKDPNEQEHMSHQYRVWRDHISRCIEDFMPADVSYALLHTSSMVGLFSCIFVKSSIRTRIKTVHATEIKRGMGGLHGNKGALVMRMVLDDSSISLVNCHLAAGQTQTVNRNNDIAAILESECLPEIASSYTPGTFPGGGDGSMILDHEICILNGDLNYRIDAMPRDTVVRAVHDNNLAKLLDRDQLLVSRRKNPGFRLRVFQEMPITFAPTYKYNVGTDNYDSSEKKRAPAWCDRVLFRGLGRIKGEDYKRWEVRVSDHRPVSARLKMRIKKVDDGKRERVWARMEQDFDRFRDRIASEAKLDYLMNVLGLSRKEALGLLNT